MFWKSKVIWSEGMLLQQQHLQQHDRYLEGKIERIAASVGGYHWGFSKLVVDEDLLALGKVGLVACDGIMQDGTAFSSPLSDDLPAPLDIPHDKRDAWVVLALPLRRPGIPECMDREEREHDSYARYHCVEHDVPDSNYGTNDSAAMQLGRLRLKLAFQDNVPDGYTTLGVVRVIERDDDGRVACDPHFVPPCTDYRVSSRLAAFVNELLGLLRQRGDSLAGRLVDPVAMGVADIHDVLLLHAVNRAEPVFAHLARVNGLHPEGLYRELLRLYGEIVGVSAQSKRPPHLEPYRHHQLGLSFDPLVGHLRQAFSRITAPQIVAVPMEERPYGLRVGVVNDVSFFSSAMFVLAVKAEMSAEALCDALVAKMKIGPVESINNLVNLQLPGLGFRLLPAPPRQLPFQAGFVYFSLDDTDPTWPQLKESRSIALYIAGDVPGLDVQLWAIRQ
jgi:type VI secretion system protein ImpJ